MKNLIVIGEKHQISNAFSEKLITEYNYTKTLGFKCLFEYFSARQVLRNWTG